MHDYKKLKVWQMSMDLVTDVYNVTSSFPKTEIYGLTSQVRRSAVSMPSNIAEGAGRSSDLDFRNFLHYSYGSSCELDTQLIIASRLKYLGINEYDDFAKRIDQNQKMLFNLIGKFS
ncbi:MAG: four helix bundle protein [Saprospiraceae bacterium]